MQRNKFRSSLIVIILGFVLFVYLFYFNKKQGKLYGRLEYEGKIDTAVIIRDFIGAKGRLYYEYQFDLEKKTNNGFIKYSPSYGPLEIGDSILIEYLPEDPDEINEPLKEENGYIKKI